MRTIFTILGATLIAADHPIGAQLQRRHLAIAADRAGLVALRQRRHVGACGTVM